MIPMAGRVQYRLLVLVFVFSTAAAEQPHSHSNEKWSTRADSSNDHAALNKFIHDVLDAKDELDSIRVLQPGSGSEKPHSKGVKVLGSHQTTFGHFYQDSDFLPALNPQHNYVGTKQLNKNRSVNIKPEKKLNKDQNNKQLKTIQIRNSEKLSRSDESRSVPYSFNKNGIERDADFLKLLLRNSRGNNLEEKQLLDTNKLSHILKELKSIYYSNADSSQHADSRQKLDVNKLDNENDQGKIMKYTDLMRFKNHHFLKIDKNDRFIPSDSQYTDREYENKYERQLGDKITDGTTKNEEKESNDIGDDRSYERHLRDRSDIESMGPVQTLSRRDSIDDSSSKISQKPMESSFEDPAVVKYFQTHGRRHNRKIVPVSRDPGNGNILFSDGGSNSDLQGDVRLAQAQKRLELEDADGLLVGMHARIGTTDNQMERENVNQDKVTPKSDQDEDIQHQLEEERRIFNSLGAGRLDNYPPYSEDQNLFLNEYRQRGPGVSNDFVKALSQITSGESNYLHQQPDGITDNLSDSNKNMLIQKFGRFARDTYAHPNTENNQNNKDKIVPDSSDSLELENNVGEVFQNRAHQDSKVSAVDSSNPEPLGNHEKELPGGGVDEVSSPVEHQQHSDIMVSPEDDPHFIRSFVVESNNLGEVYPFHTSRRLLYFEDDLPSLQTSKHEGEERAHVIARNMSETINTKRSLSYNTDEESISSLNSEIHDFADAGQRQRRDVVKRPGAIWLDEEEDVETTGEGRETVENRQLGENRQVPLYFSQSNGGTVENQLLHDNTVFHPVKKRRSGETGQNTQEENFSRIASDIMIDANNSRVKRDTYLKNINISNAEKDIETDVNIGRIKDGDKDIENDSLDFGSAGIKLTKTKRITDSALRKKIKELENKYGDDREYLKAAMKENTRGDAFGIDTSSNGQPVHKSQEISSNSESHIFDASLQPDKREIKTDSEALDDRSANENESGNIQETNERLVLEKTSTDYEDASKELKELMKSSNMASKSPKSIHIGNVDNSKNSEPGAKSAAEASRVGRSTQEKDLQKYLKFEAENQVRIKNRARSIATLSSSQQEPEFLNGDEDTVNQKIKNESRLKDSCTSVQTNKRSPSEEFVSSRLLRMMGYNLEPTSYKSDILYKKNKRDESLQESLLPNEQLQTSKDLREKKYVNSYNYVKPKNSFENVEMNELQLISPTNRHSGEGMPNTLAKERELVKRETLLMEPYESSKPTRENKLNFREEVETVKAIPLKDKDNIVEDTKYNNFEKCSRHARHARNIPQDLLSISFSPQELDRLISEGNLPVLKRVKRSTDNDPQHGEGNEEKSTRKVTRKVQDNKEAENNTRPESDRVFSKTSIRSPEVSSAENKDVIVPTNVNHLANKHESLKRENNLSENEKYSISKDEDSTSIDINVNPMESGSKHSKGQLVEDNDHVRSKYAAFTTNEKAPISSAGNNELIYQTSDITNNHDKSVKDDKHLLNKRETMYDIYNEKGMLPAINNNKKVSDFSHGYRRDSNSLYGNSAKSDLLDLLNTKRKASWFDKERSSSNEKDKVDLDFLDKTPNKDFEMVNFDTKQITSSDNKNNFIHEQDKDDLSFLEETVTNKIPEDHFEIIDFSPSEQNAVSHKGISLNHAKFNDDLRFLDSVKHSSNEEDFSNKTPDDTLELLDFDTNQKASILKQDSKLSPQKDTHDLSFLKDSRHSSSEEANSNIALDKEFGNRFSNEVPYQNFEWKSKLENEFKEKSLNDKSIRDSKPNIQDSFLNKDFSTDKESESDADLLRSVISKTPKEDHSNIDVSYPKQKFKNDLLGDKMSLKDGQGIDKGTDLVKSFANIETGSSEKSKLLDSIESRNFKAKEDVSTKILFGNDKPNSVKITDHSMNYRNHNEDTGLKQPFSNRLTNPNFLDKYGTSLLQSHSLLAKPIETENSLNEKNIDKGYRNQYHPVYPSDTNNKYRVVHTNNKFKTDHNELNKKCSDDHGNKKQGECNDGRASDDWSHRSNPYNSRLGGCAQNLGPSSTCGGFPSLSSGSLFPDTGGKNSKPYQGELDDGVVGMNIVDTILNQVYRTKHLQQTLGPGLHRKYLPTKVDKFCNQGINRQKMISEIANIINKGFEEEMKKESCNPLPPNLKEFFDWLVKAQPCPAPSNNKCEQSQSHPKHEPCGSVDDLHRKSRLLNRLNEEYEHLPDCDKHKVQSVHSMLDKDINIVNSMLLNSEKNLIQKSMKCHSKIEKSPKPAAEAKYKLPVFTFNEGDSFAGSTTEFVLPYSFLLPEDKTKRAKNSSSDDGSKDKELQNLINKDLEGLGLAPHKINKNKHSAMLDDSLWKNSYEYIPNIQNFDSSQTFLTDGVDETKPGKELERSLRSSMVSPSVSEELFHGQMESEHWPPRYGYKSFNSEPRGRVMRLQEDDEEEEAEGRNPVSEEYRRLVAQAEQARRKRAEDQS